jgi:hypothetical protein
VDRVTKNAMHEDGMDWHKISQAEVTEEHCCSWPIASQCNARVGIRGLGGGGGGVIRISHAPLQNPEMSQSTGTKRTRTEQPDNTHVLNQIACSELAHVTPTGLGL